MVKDAITVAGKILALISVLQNKVYSEIAFFHFGIM